NALFFFAHGSFEASERKRSLTNDSFRASLESVTGPIIKTHPDDSAKLLLITQVDRSHDTDNH
ncbi:MAG: hypothetical protein KZQ65_11160, partial [Candidatus Thiodiazotropha sp. (ex Gloverina cf. vestifex)]|nr:hypothetical protein [Candidatus Thiodiazotropha sp. (ex Gloverina cf. vestifex)]